MMLSDERLTAYLDDALSAQERRDVDDALARDAAARARLEGLQLSKDDIRTAFDASLAMAPSWSAPEEDAPARGGFGLAAACLALGLFVGGAGMWIAQPQATPDWKSAVAQYQALYVAQTLDTPTPSAGSAATRLSSLSEALGLDITAGQTADGLTFKRAQLLGHHGAPLVQMAFLSEDDTPFALCITPVNEAAYSARTDTLEGLAAAHWVRDGYGFVIIGGDDSAFVRKLAEEWQAVL